MIQSLLFKARGLLRSYIYTPNTIRYRVEWPRIREAFEHIGRTGKLFDGGCGSGEFARRVLTQGLCTEVVGLEPSDQNFKQLQGNLGTYPNVRIIQASLLDIPEANASMDMVMSTQVIEHIEDHETVASELVRILRPGGFALITVPHPPEPFPNDDHFREGYTEADLRALFEPLGMKVLRTSYFLTKGTTDRMARIAKWPLHGQFLPVAWVDAETSLSAAERQADTPYGILMLFQKVA
jgi:SAM-dependent methyltransferase